MAYENLSKAIKKATGYRSVITRLIAFAENELKQLHPDKTRSERIKLAHEDPFWTASKELRDLTIKEKQSCGLANCG